MKRAFTLIELIFVIVIIGLLAAIAVPKFLNLKQNAQASSVVKTTIDAAQQAVETAINYRDLGNKTFGKDYNLSTLIELKGKNWDWVNNNSVEYNASNGVVSEINLSSNEVNYSINCNGFSDPKTVEKCAKLIGNTDTNSTGVVTLTY